MPYAPPSLAVPLALGLVVFCVAERIINAIVCIFESKSSSVRKAMSGQFLASLVSATTQTVFGILYTLVSAASALLTSLLWVLALIILGSVIYVTYEQAPFVWTDIM